MQHLKKPGRKAAAPPWSDGVPCCPAIGAGENTERDEGADRSDAHKVNKSQQGHHNRERPFGDGLGAQIGHPQREEDS